MIFVLIYDFQNENIVSNLVFISINYNTDLKTKNYGLSITHTSPSLRWSLLRMLQTGFLWS